MLMRPPPRSTLFPYTTLFRSAPSLTLLPNITYTATVTTGVKDLAGNALAGNYVWSFTTGAAPDTTPPMVTSTDPANSATTAAEHTTIHQSLTELLCRAPVDTSSIT